MWFAAFILDKFVMTILNLMKENPKLNKKYYFIDESGDSAFYASGNRLIVNTTGFKPILLIGMVQVDDKKVIRNKILKFMEELRIDPLYNSLPCINDPKGWYLHASYDNVEVQIKFAEFLRKLDGFKFYCIIGRKRLDIFHKKHNKNETEFYFDLIYHLTKDRLVSEEHFHQVLLSARHKSTQNKLKESIEKALLSDNEKRIAPLKISYNCEIVLSKETPELSIVDYLLWGLQRSILRNENRFYKALIEKYTLIIDLYDNEKHYTVDNQFDPGKAAEFKTDGYI